jgi:hypothetical protein
LSISTSTPGWSADLLDHFTEQLRAVAQNVRLVCDGHLLLPGESEFESSGQKRLCRGPRLQPYGDSAAFSATLL